MLAEANRQLSPAQRRRGMEGGVVQGALWALGNGLTTGAFLNYFAYELGATGFELGLIVALPGLFGVLRLVAPAIFRLSGGYKWPCVVVLSFSYALVALLPTVPFADLLSVLDLRLFIGVLCVHQLLEYIALVGIWAWLGQIVPVRIRGRYFGLRQRWQLGVQIPTTILAGLLVDLWRGGYLLGGVKLSSSDVVWGYVAAMELGALFLVLSIVPLMAMPAIKVGPSLRVSRRLRWPEVSPFARLLLAGCWISFFAGLTSAAQNIYPFEELRIGVWGFTAMKALMQLGQLAFAPLVGRLSDRYGNRPVLALCQAIVALGPLFYFVASPAEPWWVVLAWLAFAAYVGLNVCLPNLMLKLSPHAESSHYVAVYFGVTGVMAAISATLGGWLIDKFRFSYFSVGPFTVDKFDYLFWIGFVTRLLGVLFLVTLAEPGAWRLRDVVRDWLRRRKTPAIRTEA